LSTQLKRSLLQKSKIDKKKKKKKTESKLKLKLEFCVQLVDIDPELKTTSNETFK